MTARRLRVDWPACAAEGACAAAVPELIGRDEWGYPLLSVHPVPASLEQAAERAVAACPSRALRLVEVRAAAGSRRERRLSES